MSIIFRIVAILAVTTVLPCLEASACPPSYFQCGTMCCPGR
jgi:hypothetical protein